MTREGHRITSPKERAVQAIALGCLLVLGGLAIVGPSGLLAWSENLRQLDQRHAQIAKLKHERDELKIVVDALNPNHADPDLVGELIRRDLNAVRPDEVVISLDNKDGHGTDTGN
ncbi:septum formation initiator family protein [Altererythrobacter sp. FM1]|uniref:Septum formation initiator family protein n=1 Tax=Tsuneonella flava TaxID=2055955 RepID=A0ABX7K6E1_9SPHN|nr:septum formation initiator family protein [Tsuneonella flava]QSB43805.1 septum formation initiator family protein [Tsuneonella flava]ROT95154.1 septum formation initiator family protein [Altererythrobacter sp. FM1]